MTREEPLIYSADRPGPVVPTDAAPDPAASVGNAAVPGRGTGVDPLLDCTCEYECEGRYDDTVCPSHGHRDDPGVTVPPWTNPPHPKPTRRGRA